MRFYQKLFTSYIYIDINLIENNVVKNIEDKKKNQSKEKKI